MRILKMMPTDPHHLLFKKNAVGKINQVNGKLKLVC